MSKKILFAIVASAFLLQTFFAWADMRMLMEKTMYDDAFYLKGIQNFVEGKGLSVDGVFETNGFQPLELFIIAPAFWLFKGNLFLPMHILLSVLGIFHILTVLLVWKIVMLLTKNENAAHISAFFYAFSPFAFILSLSGMEQSIYVFFVSASIYQYLKMRTNEKSAVSERNEYASASSMSDGKSGKVAESGFSAKNLAILGVLLGLAFLSRLDAVFLIAPLMLDMAYLSFRRKGGFAVTFKRILVSGAALALVAFPWLLWSYFKFGALLPSSGQAIIFLTQEWRYFNTHTSIFTIDYLIELFKNVIQSFRVAVSLLVALKQSVFLPNMILLGGIAGILVSGALKNIFGFKSRLSKLSPVWFVFAYVLLAFFYYPLVQWLTYQRYYLFLILLAAIVFGFLFDACLAIAGKFSESMQRRSALFMGVLLAIGFALSFASFWQDGLAPWQTELYDATQWINANTPKDAVIAGFNTGITGYFTERTLVNLDGAVNNDAVAALKGRRMMAYLKERNVDYLVDYKTYVVGNGPYFGDADYLKKLEPVYIAPINSNPFRTRLIPADSPVIVYRINYGN